MRVALVVVTLNRARILAGTLRAACAQTRPPDRIFVVDNGSSDETFDMLARDFAEVEILKSGDNVGVNAGLTIGMQAAVQEDFDAFWILDDDTVPPPDSLEELLRALEAVPGAAGIGYQGGNIRLGWIRHFKTPEAVRRLPELAPGIHRVDFFLVDGALVTRRAVDAVGYPPADYFMMIGDIEYSFRMTRAGFRLGVFERDRLVRARLGKEGDASGKPAWRAYYKARNHVRMALVYHSPVLLLGALARVVQLCLSHLLKGEGARAAAILRGTLDGFRGRMGRTVEPSGP